MEGLAIYNQLIRHKAYKTVYIDGFACSIASVIAMAGDKVIMPRNTIMMIHNAWTWCMGNAAELRKQADDLDIISEAICQAYLIKANGKLSEKTLKSLLDEGTYLTAKQCIDYGLADEYAENDIDIEQAKKGLQNAKHYEPIADRLVAMIGQKDLEVKTTDSGQEEKKKREEIKQYIMKLKNQYEF